MTQRDGSRGTSVQHCLVENQFILTFVDQIVVGKRSRLPIIYPTEGEF